MPIRDWKSVLNQFSLFMAASKDYPDFADEEATLQDTGVCYEN
jgi:hypothetical protein